MEDHNYICIEKEEYDDLHKKEFLLEALMYNLFKRARLYDYGSTPELRFDDVEDIVEYLFPFEYEKHIKRLTEKKEANN